MRYLLAILIASLVPSVLHIVAGVIMSRSWTFSSEDILLLVGISGGVSLLGLFLLGIPLVMLLKKLKCLNYINIVVVSFLLGGVIITGLVLYNVYPYQKVTIFEFVYQFGYGGILATSIAITFLFLSGIINQQTKNRAGI